MKVYLTDKGIERELSYIDPKSGFDFTSDFIGNCGAFNDGQFEYDEENDRFDCESETFDWWEKVIEEHEALDQRIIDLINKYSDSEEEIQEIINDFGSDDLEMHCDSINQALDQFEEEQNA